jgi:hypothetical protein
LSIAAISRSLISVFAIGLSFAPAVAKTHYVTPLEAPDVPQPDGSISAPWTSLRMALQNVVGGDLILLYSGHFGNAFISNVNPDSVVTIRAETPGTVSFERLQVAGSSNLAFADLGLWRRKSGQKPGPLVLTNASSHNISFDNIDLRGRKDALESYFSWSQADWDKNWRASGIRMLSTNSTVSNSRFTGLAFAISLEGDRGLAENNWISGFSGDALRGIGQNTVFRNNHVENCFKVNANHDDGFQAWAPKSDPISSRILRGLRIENNTILEWTGPKDHPLRCALQGIGLFDGMFEDVVIRNNLVAVTHYHGISIYGARNVKVLNNTVVNPSGAAVKYPWIMLQDHRNGYRSTGNLVARNVAMAFSNKSSDRIAFDQRSNLATRYPVREYQNLHSRDFRLKSNPNNIGANLSPLSSPIQRPDESFRRRGR